MRALTVLAALALGSVAAPASAATEAYGVAFDRTFYSFDPIRGDTSGLRNPGATFTFDTATNQLVAFNLDLGYPVNSITPQVRALLANAGSCDLACFIGAINGGTWLTTSARTGTTDTTLTFGGPLNGSVEVRAPFAAGFVTLAGTMRVTGPVPEPGTWALMLLGFGAIGYALRRRRPQTALA